MTGEKLLFKHSFDLDRQARARQKGQKPCVLWFYGLSASGKSTLANATASALHARGYHVYGLDGDNLRLGLNRDLGFSPADRAENFRRAAEAAYLLLDAGLIVLASFITPGDGHRRMVRACFPEGSFFEIFIDTPLDICIQRDPKGLYAKALVGELDNFPGVSFPFEVPGRPDLRLDGSLTAAALVERVLAFFDRIQGG